MRNIFKIIIIMGLSCLLFANCEESNCDCENDLIFESDSIANFVYSLTYGQNYSYVNVGMTNVSKIEDLIETEYEWYLNGAYIGDGKNDIDTKYYNGHYTIVHKVIYKGVEYSSVKEFEVTELE